MNYLYDAINQRNITNIKDITDQKNDNGLTPLMSAAQEGNIDLVNSLLEKGIDIDEINSNKSTALMIAASHGHTKIVLSILSYGADINFQNNKGWSALMLAAQKGNLETINVLLSNGANILIRNKQGWSALIIASIVGNYETLSILINYYDDVYTKQFDIDTALILSAKYGNYDITRLLIDHGANIYAKQKDGFNAFTIAVNNGHNELVLLLLAQESIRENNTNAIEIAANAGNKDTLLILIEAGFNLPADTTNAIRSLSKFSWWTDAHSAVINNKPEEIICHDINDKKYITPLSLAIMCNNNAITNLYINKNSDFDLNSCCHTAYFANRKDLQKYFEEKGARLNEADKKGMNIIMKASSIGRNDILMSHITKFDINAKNSKGWTALMIASHNGHNKTVALLLNKGANIDDITEDGLNLLMLAIRMKNIDTADFLIDKISINARQKSGWTALMLASYNGDITSIKLLLKKGANINAQDKDGYTALMLAAIFSKAEAISILLEKGANIDQKDNTGWTALMLAINHGNIETIKLLLNKKSDINAVQKDGITPLMIAAKKGHKEIIQILLSNAAKLENKSIDGKTALLYGIESGHPEAIKLLIENGAILPDDKSKLIITLKKYSWWTDNHTAVINSNIDKIQKYEHSESEITPLDLAIIIGNIEAVKAMITLDVKYDINNCLRTAIKAKRNDVTIFLLELGVDHSSNNKLGKNSFQTGRSYGN